MNWLNQMKYGINSVANLRMTTPDMSPKLTYPSLDFSTGRSGNTKTPGNFNAAKVGNALMSAMGTYQIISDAFNYDKTADQLLNEGGYRYGNIGGYGFKKYNGADFEGEIAEIKAQSKSGIFQSAASAASTLGTAGSLLGPVVGVAGTIVGGIGGAIAGIFGGKSREEEARRRLIAANEKATRYNAFNRSSAYTDYLQNEYDMKYGDTENQILLSRRGKDVVTPVGKMQGKPNAYVSKGEPVLDNIGDVSNAVAYVPKKGRPGADDQAAYLTGSSKVLGYDKDWRDGISFMKKGQRDALALEHINKTFEMRTNDKMNKLRGNIGRRTDELQQEQVNTIKAPIVNRLKDLANQQRYQHEMEGYYGKYMAKRGKDGVKCFSGWDNTLAAVTGGLMSLAQYNQAKNSTPYRPNIYAENPYEKAALNKLASLKINSYPIIQEMRNAQRAANLATSRSGGLSGAQKYLANVVNAHNYYNTIGKVMPEIQAKNNAYASDAATKTLATGEATAKRKMTADEYAENYYAKSHAARQAGMQTAMANALSQMQQYIANANKLKMYNKMYNLYADDADKRKEDIVQYLKV